MLIGVFLSLPHAKQERKAISELKRTLKLANFLLKINYFTLQTQSYKNKSVDGKPSGKEMKGASILSFHLALFKFS